MKTLAFLLFISTFLLSTTSVSLAQSVNGDINLPDVSSGKNFSFSQLEGAKGIIVFFTSEHCPYSKLYEKRITKLAEEMKAQGILTVMVNPNDAVLSPDDAVDKMKEKKYPFPYLADKQQQCVKMFNAQKTPEVFLIKPSGNNYEIVYQGAFDDNPMSEEEVTETFLANASRALLAGKVYPKKSTRPTGCMIKSR